MQFFEVKAQYEGLTESGKQKKFKVSLLVNAETFGDAEAMTYQHLDGHQEIQILGIKKSTISEVFGQSEENPFFLVTAEFLSIDEDTGKEAKRKLESLIGAEDTTEAAGKYMDAYMGFTSPYEIRKVVYSPITELVNIDQ